MARLIILFFSLLSQANAFTLNNTVAAAFDMDNVDEVLVNVADHTCTNIDLTNDQLLDLVNEAVDEYWNRVHTSSLILKKGSISNVSNDFQTGLICTNPGAATCDVNDDLKVSSGVLIACNTDLQNFSNSSTVLAVTVPNNVSGNTINGALILINDDVSNLFDGLSRSEQVATIAHEIGHAVGLGHTDLNENLMYFETIPSRFTLGRDDVDGVTYLYPVEQPLSGCGTIEYTDKQTGRFLMTFFAALLLSLVFKLSKLGRMAQKSAPFARIFLRND